MLEVRLSRYRVEQPAGDAVDQPAVAFRIGAVGHRQVPRREDLARHDAVARRAHLGVGADRGPRLEEGVAARLGIDARGHHAHPFPVLDVPAPGVLGADFHIHLGHQPPRGGGTDGLGGVEMLEDDAEGEPQRELAVLLLVGERDVEGLEVGQLGRQRVVADFPQHVVVVGAVGVGIVADLLHLGEDFPGARIVLLAQLEPGAPVLVGEVAVGTIRPSLFLVAVFALEPARLGHRQIGRRVEQSLGLAQRLVGAHAFAFLELQEPGDVGLGSPRRGKNDAEHVFRIVVALVRSLGRLLVGEHLVRIETEPVRHLAPLGDDDVEVGLGVRRRLGGLVGDVDAALRILVGAALLAEGGGGQHQVGIEEVRRVAIALGHHHEGLLHRRAHQRGDVWHIDMGGVGELEHLQLAPVRPLHHADGKALVLAPRCLRQPRRGHAPGPGDVIAVEDIAHTLVERQPAGQPAHQALGHGVGLAGHRERTRPGARDVAGEQMQVDQGQDVVLAVDRLVPPADAPERQHAAASAGAAPDRRPGPFPRHPAHQVGGEPGPVDHLLRAVAGEDALAIGVEPRGVIGDEFLVDGVGVLLQQHMGDGVDERDVAVGLDRHTVRVGGADLMKPVHGAGIARVHHHGGNAALLLLGGHAPVQHRVRAARVVAEEVDHVGVFDVLVAAGRMVAAQCGDVAGDRRGHAHARIRLDGVRLQDGLHVLVLEPLLFHGELARAVGADGVAAEPADDVDGHVDQQL